MGQVDDVESAKNYQGEIDTSWVSVHGGVVLLCLRNEHCGIGLYCGVDRLKNFGHGRPLPQSCAELAPALLFRPIRAV